jgi:hypothetical protein
MAKPEEAEQLLNEPKFFRSFGETLNREQARLFFDRVMTELSREEDIRWIWQKITP